MGFVKSQEEPKLPATFDFYDAEILLVVWETNPATVARLLPPPLKPAARPIASAYVANFPRTNFGVTYREAALSLAAEYEGIEGSYYLAMPVTDDMALIGGRELFGYPKKIADIFFYHKGQEAGGWAERHGIRYFELRASLAGQFNTPEAATILAESLRLTGGSSTLLSYNFKYFLAPSLDGFDYAPRLVREEIELNPSAVEFGAAEIVLRASDFDPWSEVPVEQVLGAIYVKGNTSMKPGNVVAEVDPVAFAPYSRLKMDPF